MDEASAKNVICTSIRAMALFDQLVSDLQSSLPEEEFGPARQAIGNVMGEIGELINESVRLHPALKPYDGDTWRAAGRLSEPNWLRLE